LHSAREWRPSSSSDNNWSGKGRKLNRNGSRAPLPSAALNVAVPRYRRVAVYREELFEKKTFRETFLVLSFGKLNYTLRKVGIIYSILLLEAAKSVNDRII